MAKFILGLILSLLSVCSFAQSTDYYLENLGATDTYIRSSAPNNTFGLDPNLITGGWGDMYIALSKFNISNLPSIASGDKVSIWLYNKSPGSASQASPAAVNMGMLASDFSDYTTWNTGLSWYTSTVRQVNVSAYGYWTEFDITDYYNYWKSGVANYGVALVPLNTNNQFNLFQSASTSTPASQKPILRITKANSKILLKWPLSTPYNSRVITQEFGVDWAGGSYCPANVIKKHNGTDYRASAGDPVFAAESGYVKIIIDGGIWGKAIVIEHTMPDNTKFTTVYWHIVPSVAVGPNKINKGDNIGSIANISSGPHLHFGVRDSAYDTYTNTNGKVSVFAGTGALPQQDCVDQDTQKFYPGFPEKFLNIENNTRFSFQQDAG